MRCCIFNLPNCNLQTKNTQFKGKSRFFLNKYQQQMPNVPLKDTVISSISDPTNIIGEGMSKIVYNLKGFNHYVVRVFKKSFVPEDLNLPFTKPNKNNVADNIDGVILTIPGKIDITPKKNGIGIGIHDYSERIEAHKFPPLQNIFVSREETLQVLNLYKQLKDFQPKAYKDAYKQLMHFCKYPGFQMDIINPNNILIDTKKKKINLIDALGPEVNDIVQGKNIDLSAYHGCDSLYPVLCDFLMQKEHLNNLTEPEKLVWKKTISCIIEKCINAGKSLGLNRNIEQLDVIYQRINKFWKTDKIGSKYNEFLELYAGTIKKQETINKALEIKNSTQERINAIQHLEAQNFDELKPVFDTIIEAPHQPKVEVPEILNAAIDKISEYKESAKSILPTLEKLFDKEIFYPTKKRLYNLFIEIEPENIKFLYEIEKSANNEFEKILYKNEINKLYQKSKNYTPKNIERVKLMYHNASENKQLSEEIINKYWISRTCTNTNEAQELSLKNIQNAYEYIEAKKNQIPKTSDLVEIHKRALQNTPGQEKIIGQIRRPELDYIFASIHKVKTIPKNAIRLYSLSKDVQNDLDKLDKYITENYHNTDTFELAANTLFEVIRIHPFFNGNGRASRLFIEQLLLSKGYKLVRWPEETLYLNLYSKEQFAAILKQNCVKIEK